MKKKRKSPLRVTRASERKTSFNVLRLLANIAARPPSAAVAEIRGVQKKQRTTCGAYMRENAVGAHSAHFPARGAAYENYPSDPRSAAGRKV